MPRTVPIRPSALLAYAVQQARRVNTQITNRLRFSPESALARVHDPKKDPNNQPLRIDYYAEDFYSEALEGHFKGKVCAIGEETLGMRKDLADISDRKEIFAILDIIDGTDLLLRQIGNWCSAIVFYYPPGREIVCSIVADAEGNVFYATKEEDCAFYLPKGSRFPDGSIRLHISQSVGSSEEACIRFFRKRESGPRSAAVLANASLCFVGQKPPYFLAAAENVKFRQKLSELCRLIEQDHRPVPAFRIYNLGGIPMMPKVANGVLDAVIGLKPSKPHDFVAGAFIALRAGAFLGDMTGKGIDDKGLAAFLNSPDARCPPYILSASESLYGELLECFHVENEAAVPASSGVEKFPETRGPGVRMSEQ